MNFKKMNVKKKLLVAFIIVALVSSMSGVISVFVMNNMDKGYSNALTNYGFAQGDIGEALVCMAEAQKAVVCIVSFTDRDDITSMKEYLAEMDKEYTEIWFPKVAASLQTDEGKVILDDIKTKAKNWATIMEKVLEIGDTTDPVRSQIAQKMMVEELFPAYDEFYGAFSNLMDNKQKNGNSLSDKLSAGATTSMVMIGVLSILAFVISIGLGIFIANGISRPVNDCSRRLALLAEGDLSSPVPEPTTGDEVGAMLISLDTTVGTLTTIINDVKRGLAAVAEGDLTVTTDLTYPGDFSELRSTIERIIVSLSSTLGRISTASEQVDVGSDQVSQGAQALSQGAMEQASSVEELAATITDISEHIKQNARNAETANELSNEAGAGVMDSNQKMKEMLQAMEDITETSNEIGKIIKAIDDIAFQTNILALNAAVEAARAGAAGKGFAVVADEVRNLAQKSAEAAKNTTQLIENAIVAIENGTKIADEAGQALEEVVEKAGVVAENIQKIAEASKEQAEAIAQVTMGVDQISSVVQTNSATSEESAAASEELAGQATLLKELVGKFKLLAG